MLPRLHQHRLGSSCKKARLWPRCLETPGRGHEVYAHKALPKWFSEAAAAHCFSPFVALESVPRSQVREPLPQSTSFLERK